jgi:hypothetical protein
MRRTVVAVQLETFRMTLGEKLYKNYRSIPGDLLWVLSDTHLFIGDVFPHRTLLAMGSLKRDHCPEKDFKKKLLPLIGKTSSALDAEIIMVNAAGGCKLDGSDVVTSPGTFGLGEMILSPEVEAEILAAAAKHFRDYKVPSETGAYDPRRQD